MAIFDLFSKRQKRINGKVPDVYQYDEIDDQLRVQVIHIIRDAIGEEVAYNDAPNEAYEIIHKALCREYGKFILTPNSRSNFSSVYDYFLSTKNIQHCLDIIELSFKVIDIHVREKIWNFQQSRGYCQHPDSAIQELNDRLRESAVGFQFESGEIIRVDSQLIHSEVIKPVLFLLGKDRKYSGANAEFLSAHEHYRHGRYKETLVDCLKSFESLMKAIFEKRKWKYEKSDSAKNLINICFQNNLIPSYMQTQFSSLRAILESGVPTIRNKEGGHGQGVEITQVPEQLASYIIHLTASNLLFLANCEMSMT